MISAKRVSSLQEKKIKRSVGGNLPANSGGTRFGGGDVLTDHFLIEAKTPMEDKKSFSIKKDWITKAKEQAFEQGKDNFTLAFRFGPDQENFYVIDEKTFKMLNELCDIFYSESD